MSARTTRRLQMASAFSGIVLGAVVTSTPAWASPSTQVNTDNIQRLSNGLAWYALAACVVGICISSALWAMGSKGQNPGQELTGKKGLILCCTAAFFIGATPHLINFFSKAADSVERDAAGMNISTPAPAGSSSQPIGKQGMTGAGGPNAQSAIVNGGSGASAAAARQQQQQAQQNPTGNARPAPKAKPQEDPIPDLRNGLLCEDSNGQKVACKFK